MGGCKRLGGQAERQGGGGRHQCLRPILNKNTCTLLAFPLPMLWKGGKGKGMPFHLFPNKHVEGEGVVGWWWRAEPFPTFLEGQTPPPRPNIIIVALSQA